MRTFRVPGAAAALALPGLAAAQASFGAQQRGVAATSHGASLLWDQNANPFFPDFDPPTTTYTADHSDGAQAPDFGSFGETATSSAPLIQGFIGPAASSSAAQTSSLAANQITASGSFAAQADSYTIPQATLDFINLFLNPPVDYTFGIIDGEETGQSQFSVSFSVAQATPFHLTGNVAVSAMQIIGEVLFPLTSSDTSISLTGPSGSVAQLDLSQPSTSSTPSPPPIPSTCRACSPPAATRSARARPDRPRPCASRPAASSVTTRRAADPST